MAILVIDFSKLDGPERAETMADIAAGFEHVGFFQLVDTGIPDELLERVKKVCSEATICGTRRSGTPTPR